MTANERTLLRHDYASWKVNRNIAGNEGRRWLYYALEQILKPFDLDDEQIEAGITDKGNDGGVDAMYILVNKGQLLDAETKLNPRGVTQIHVLFVQAKSSGGFGHTQIDKLVPFTEHFFDLDAAPESYGARYNDHVKRHMGIWRENYLKVSGSAPDIFIDYYYVTGDDSKPDILAIGSGDEVKKKAVKQTRCTSNFHYIGAEELWTLVQRRPSRAKILRWAGNPMEAQDAWVGRVQLKHFHEFLADEDGNLSLHIFDSNVRGYQTHSDINSKIGETLAGGPESTEFWWLNNGVTVISPKVTGGYQRLTIEDPQIVNGLQTSQELFEYARKTSNVASDPRSVLVRVIETDDAEIQDNIIRATNSQNRMAVASLRMTDQVHRNIEAFLRKSELYYDRRKGQYRNERKPVRKIISATAMAQAVISVLLQKPDDARARPGDYFEDEKKYETIYAENRIPLGAYLNCILIVRAVEEHFRVKKLGRGDQRNLKFYVAALVAREMTGIEVPPPAVLERLNGKNIDSAVIADCTGRVDRAISSLTKTTGRDKATVARGVELLRKLNTDSRRRATARKNGNAGKKA